MENSSLIKQHNCLTTIRLLAALQVMLGHVREYLPLPQWMEPIRRILSLFPGVPMFFMLSGFLIWNSIEHSAGWKQYMGKRFLRIYPELWIAVLFEILSILLLYPGAASWLEMAAFTFGQATIFQFWKPASLEGFGCGTPNGALWTIPVIVFFYILVWWAHKLLHKKGKAFWAAGFLFCFAVSISIHLSQQFLSEIPYKLLQYSVLPYLWIFYIGMFAAEHFRQLLPLVKKYWFVCILSAVALRHWHLDTKLGYYPLLDSSLLFLGWVGFAYRFPQLNLRKDISYGLYIYHMIIANMVLVIFGNQQQWLAFAVFAVSIFVAWISSVVTAKGIKACRAKLT